MTPAPTSKRWARSVLLMLLAVVAVGSVVRASVECMIGARIAVSTLSRLELPLPPPSPTAPSPPTGSKPNAAAVKPSVGPSVGTSAAWLADPSAASSACMSPAWRRRPALMVVTHEMASSLDAEEKEGRRRGEGGEKGGEKEGRRRGEGEIR